MARAATVSREEAGKQQREIAPPTPALVVPEAPKSAAPGSHPGAPVESDMEALADYQGANRLANRGNVGAWKLDAWNRPVWVPGRPAGGTARASARNLSEPEEPILPPGQRGEELSGQPSEKPAPRREK